VASILAHQKNRVLVVDLDPQSNAAFALGVDPAAPGAADLLLGRKPAPIAVDDRLHVLPGGPQLNDHRIQSLDPEELADAVKGMEYEAMVFDCPPGNEHLERFAITAASTALVVVDAHPFAIVGATRVLEVLDTRRGKGRKGPERWAFVMSRLDGRRSADRELAQALAEGFPKVPRLDVRQDVALAAATADRVPVMKACPASRGVADLTSITRWLRHG
jgi:chromosome partitioning protein